jgi:hypothetical protein
LMVDSVVPEPRVRFGMRGYQLSTKDYQLFINSHSVCAAASGGMSGNGGSA